MRKLIVQEWLSLDGYVADKAGGLDFFTNLSPEANTYSDQDQLQWLEAVDTILLGRKTYELFVKFWPSATSDQEIIADKLNSTPKLVFSTSLQQAPWGKWPEAEIIRGEAANAIRTLKTQAGKNMVLWGSISLAQALLQAKLVDELHLQLCPTVTGGGRAFFPQGEQLPNMHLLEVKRYETGVVFLRYAPNP